MISKTPDRRFQRTGISIDELEKRLNRHDEILAKDDRRLENIETGNRYTQRALLALLSHGIDGNEVEAMRKAKEELKKLSH